MHMTRVYVIEPCQLQVTQLHYYSYVGDYVCHVCVSAVVRVYRRLSSPVDGAERTAGREQRDRATIVGQKSCISIVTVVVLFCTN